MVIGSKKRSSPAKDRDASGRSKGDICANRVGREGRQSDSLPVETTLSHGLLGSPSSQCKLEEVQGVLGLDLLSFNDIGKHVLVSLDKDPRISLPMDQLLIAVSLDSAHQGVYLFNLDPLEFGVGPMHPAVDVILVSLDLLDLKGICLLSQLIGLGIVLAGKVLPLHQSHVANLLAHHKGVVLVHLLLSELKSL